MYKTMEELDAKGKNVLLRVDLNAQIENGKPVPDVKFYQHAKTVLKLSEKGARVVVIAHQGRPGDTFSFVSLEKHAQLLSNILGRPVKFTPDLTGPTALKEISSLSDGDVLLLENLRFFSEEILDRPSDAHAESVLVRSLSSACDVFVNDAFGVMHRNHASLSGFPEVMPSYAGDLLEKEVAKLDQMLASELGRGIFIFGGNRAGTPLEAITRLLQEGIADKVLLSGLIAQLFLKAKGYALGEESEAILRGKGLYEALPLANELYHTYTEKILLPIDFGVERGGDRDELGVSHLPTRHTIFDIGSKTMKAFQNEIKNANMVFAHGAMGYYEDPKFASGTQAVLEALNDSHATSYVCGSSLRELAFETKATIDFISTGGESSLLYLARNDFSALRSLVRSAARFDL